MKKFLYFGTTFLVMLITSYFLYYFPKMQQINETIYLNKSSEMKATFQNEIKIKQEKTMNLVYLISQDRRIIEALSKKDSSNLNYKQTIETIEKQGEYKNLWLHIISSDGYSFYRSWTDNKDDLILNAREDLKDLIKHPKPIQTISAGIYDLSLKTIFPVYDKDKFLGFVELISKFNSIAIVLEKKGIEPLFLLSSKYSKKLIFPFTNQFLKENYVVNNNASKDIMKIVENIGVESFLTDRNYLLIDKYLVYSENIKDSHNANLGLFLLFFDKDHLDQTEITNFKINYLLMLVIFIVIYILLFLYYLKTSYAKELNQDVQNKTKKINDQKKRLKSLLEIYDKNVIFSKTDLNGTITHASYAFCRISGYTKSELLGKPHNIVRHPDMPKEFFENLWKNLKEQKRVTVEIKNLKKDGSYYWVVADLEPEYDENGKHVGYFAVREDITANKEIEEIQKEIIFTMGSIAEFRSKETGEHIKRVAKYSRILATYYGLDEADVNMLELASPMHDIGKIAISDDILNKPGKLTVEEFEIIKTHAQKGFEMLQVSERPLLKAASQIALTHHEKYDGSGYPNGLKGEDIPIFGRITALADVFDALSSDRCYKKAWELDNVLNFIKSEKGKHFDPKLVNIFFDNLNKFLEIKEKYKDL